MWRTSDSYLPPPIPLGDVALFYFRFITFLRLFVLHQSFQWDLSYFLSFSIEYVRSV